MLGWTPPADGGGSRLMGLSEKFEAQVAQYSADVLRTECALIEIGRESARRFDAGNGADGSRVHRVLTDLRKLAERWERLTVPAPAAPEVTELDKIRARRAAQGP